MILNCQSEPCAAIKAVCRGVCIVALSFAGCTASRGTDGPAGLPDPLRNTATPVLTVIDAQGDPAPASAEVILSGGTDGLYAVATGAGSPGRSLFLELRCDPQPGAWRVELAEYLRDSALLLALRSGQGSMQLGVAAIGEEAALPAGSPLLELAFDAAAGNPAAPPLRAASKLPASAVADLHFDDEDILRMFWTCYNNGDYDQNGEVTIGDITPVAVTFGATDGSAGWDSKRVADGDQNGEVNAADIQQIAVNFGSSVASFHVLEADSSTDPFEPTGGVKQFDSAPVGEGGGPREFDYVFANPAVGHFFAVRISDGETQAAQHSNEVEFNPDNLPPQISATHDGGATVLPGTTVSFDASASLDPDGAIDLYEWDIFGDGDWVGSGSTATYQYLYTKPGSYTPRNRCGN